MSGTTWTVVRGAESTVPVPHAAGFTIYQVTSAGSLGQLKVTDWLNAVTMFGAVGDGVTDNTTALQNMINAAAGSPGIGCYIPAGAYRVSQLTLASGTILRGSSSGTYPGNNTIPGITVLERLASTNLDLLLAPDGTNYCRIYDLAIDGNKNNNSSGMGLNIADGAAGQECQFIIERCYFHDNPDSNLYLGHNRRASKVQYSTFLQSANGDGITVCGSDNLIMSCIIGSNGRAGINLGSTVSQNWAAFGSNQNAVLTHVINCDIFKNNVGICLPSNASQAMILGNGIDRNNLQGITVYNGDVNVIIGNALHSNGQAADNTYAHIDVASGVSSVSLANNIFGPLDAGITNLCTTCVNIASWTNNSIISGNIGYADTINPDTHSGLINSQAFTPAAVRLSNAGATIQGSGNDIVGFRGSTGTQVVKITNGGALVCLQAGSQYQAAQNVMGSLTALSNAVLSLVGTATGVAQLKTQQFASQTADIADFFASNGTTLLAAIDVAGRYLGPDPVSNQLYGYLAQAFDPAMCSGGAGLGTAGAVLLIKIPWPVTQSVTNIIVRVSGGGTSLTSGQNFAGLYDSSGNRLGVTADQSGVWNTAGSTPKTMAISGGPITVTGGGSAGFIYVALLWNGSASPSFIKAVNNDTPSFNGALSAATLRCGINSSANTSLPSSLTLSSSTTAANLFWAALS